jgi:hypothetical protein
MPAHKQVPETRWRALAAEARACADEIRDPRAQRILKQIAAAYERLAARARAGNLPRPPIK